MRCSSGGPLGRRRERFYSGLGRFGNGEKMTVVPSTVLVETGLIIL